MAFPLGPLPLVKLPGPELLPGGLPGELVEGVAQGLHTSIPLMGLAIAAALVSHWGCARQGLDATCRGVPLPVITPFRQEPGSQALPRSWQATEKGVIRVLDEKTVDLLVVDLDLLYQEGQLLYQHQHQPAFGAGGHWVGLQLGLAHLGVNL